MARRRMYIINNIRTYIILYLFVPLFAEKIHKKNENEKNDEIGKKTIQKQ